MTSRDKTDWRRPVILVGMAYEAVALRTERLPTISALLYRASRHPQLRILTWLALGYIAYHFLVEMGEAAEQVVAEAIEALDP